MASKVKVEKCPLCGATEWYKSGTYKQEIGLIDYVFCPRCGLQYQYPERWVIDYEEEYRILTKGRGYTDYGERKTEYMRGIQIVDAIDGVLTMPKLPVLVDVGSANGFLCGLMKDRWSDAIVYGVEPNNKTRNFAGRPIGPLYFPSFSELKQKHFDLVTCIHVLEHIPEPVPFMKQITERADYAFIEVPYGFSQSMGSAFHPTGWGWAPLSRLMTMCGFVFVPGTKLIHSWPLLATHDTAMQALFRSVYTAENGL